MEGICTLARDVLTIMVLIAACMPWETPCTESTTEAMHGEFIDMTSALEAYMGSAEGHLI